MVQTGGFRVLELSQVRDADRCAHVERFIERAGRTERSTLEWMQDFASDLNSDWEAVHGGEHHDIGPLVVRTPAGQWRFWFGAEAPPGTP